MKSEQRKKLAALIILASFVSLMLSVIFAARDRPNSFTSYLTFVIAVLSLMSAVLATFISHRAKEARGERTPRALWVLVGSSSGCSPYSNRAAVPGPLGRAAPARRLNAARWRCQRATPIPSTFANVLSLSCCACGLGCCVRGPKRRIPSLRRDGRYRDGARLDGDGARPSRDERRRYDDDRSTDA